MKDATVIITEKKNISDMIVRAIAPETFDERGSCSAEHRDIFTIRIENDWKRLSSRGQVSPSDCVVLLKNPNNRRERSYKDSEFNYFCGPDCMKCDFLAQHIDSMGMRHARSTRQKLRHRRELGKDKQVIENISYYVIEKEHEYVIVMDTEGTPYNYRDHNLEGMIHHTKNWDDMEKTLESLRRANFSLREKKSHKLRKRLLNQVLAKRLLPVTRSTPVNLKRVISATDYDVAGSFIFYSVIADANNHLRNNLKRKGAENFLDLEEISDDMLFRMKLQSSDISNLVNEFKNPAPFDWGHAYAGKARDVFDFLYGRTISNELRFHVRERVFNMYRNGEVNLEKGAKLTNISPEDFSKILEHERIPTKEDDTAYIELRKKNKSRKEEDEQLRVSHGRVRFLSLEKIIEQEVQIENASQQEHLYLIFPGLPDRDGIQRLLDEKNFVAMHTKEQLAHITPSRILKLLRDAHIGTHTTRYMQMNDLIGRGLATCHNEHITITPFGRRYAEILKPYVSTKQFSLIEWNDKLHVFMERLKALELSREQCEGTFLENVKQEYMTFMEEFFIRLKPHLQQWRRAYPDIAKRIIEEYEQIFVDNRQVEKREKIEQSKQDGNNYFVLRGNDAFGEDEEQRRDEVLSSQQIGFFIDKQNNCPLPEEQRIATIVRSFPQHAVNIDDYVRRICCIDKENDVNIINANRIERLLELDRGHYTVFRAKAENESTDEPLYDLNELLAQPLKIESFTELDMPETPKEDKKVEAHESLGLRNVGPSDVIGKDGLLLVQEYHKPWTLTLDKIEKKEKNLINLASFTANGINFERAERYEFGKVHNFESLLIAMYEKYGFLFEYTSDMAEELYLNTR